LESAIINPHTHTLQVKDSKSILQQHADLLLMSQRKGRNNLAQQETLSEHITDSISEKPIQEEESDRLPTPNDDIQPLIFPQTKKSELQ
jgi:hypothetical protein